ncbi:MAG: thioredoxin domain-containing protein [Acidobacteria bacterium]|nr:thioredoxin domain-containing protein [Acidobacteriota bacterium]
MVSKMSARLSVPVSERDHVQGSPDAAVTLVEYGDFECPHCGAAHLVVKQIQKTLGDQLRFVFRHFPLAQIHPHAERAAEAAEAAGAQGRFWQMHDLLFEHQQSLSDRHLLLYAEAIDLDTDRFARELAEHVYQPRVREDFMSGVRSGVNGTPTFFINGARHDGLYDVSSLLDAIQRAGSDV